MENVRQLTDDQAQALAALPLAGKHRPLESPRAYLMHGPSGAGKSTTGRALYEALPQHTKDSTVYISADEHGAGDSNKAYRNGIKGADAQTRHKLWKKYQADHDHICALTLDLAIAGGYSVFVDSTSSDPHGPALAKRLMDTGYTIAVSSFWAPLPVCVERVMGRERQADPSYLLSKRLGAFKSLVPLSSMANVIDFYFTSEEGQKAGLAPGLALSAWQTHLSSLPVRTTTNHPNLLAGMIRAMMSEGTPVSLAPLTALIGDISQDDQRSLQDYGKLLVLNLQSLAGRHLLPYRQGRPRPI